MHRRVRRAARERVIAGVGALAAIAAAVIAIVAVRARGDHADDDQPTRSATPATAPTAMLDPDHDPWAAHAAHPAHPLTGSTAPTELARPPAADTSSDPIPVAPPAPTPTAFPPALQAQLDLHPAASNIVLAISGTGLRASTAMTLATRGSTQLTALTARCGFDVLAKVDELVISATMRNGELVFDISARGAFADTAGAAEHCIAALFGGTPTITKEGALGAITRIEGGGHVAWVSHPDNGLVFATTRPDGNHLSSPRERSVRHGALAQLLGVVDPKATVWLVGQPDANTIELLPGVASPRSMYGAMTLTGSIDMRGGLRFDDAANAVAAARALRAKLAELDADPIGHMILGDAKISLADHDAVFTVSIQGTFATLTLQSLFKYLAEPQ